MTAWLADTQALLWWLSDDSRLSSPARELIADGEVRVSFSVASVWEAEIKAASGKLTMSGDLLDALVADGFVELAITARHAREAARLPLLHRDPFDRMIAAQALHERLTVITSDRKIAEYGVSVLW